MSHPASAGNLRHCLRNPAVFAIAVPLLVLVLCQQSARGQQNIPPKSQESVASKRADPPLSSNSGKFYDKELDLHFNYPVEMQVLDGKAEMESGHKDLYGEPGENDPEHREAAHCIRFHLVADLPTEKAPRRMADDGGMWIDDTDEYKNSRKPQPIFAKIVLTEVLPTCLPKKTADRVDDTLASMARELVSFPGLLPAPKPLWYETAKQKIHMNCSIGRFKLNGQLDPAPMIVMAMSTEWHGHLLAWAFTSNDITIFNQITKSLVQFGDGSWGQMFPGNLGPAGSGTPLTILPN